MHKNIVKERLFPNNNDSQIYEKVQIDNDSVTYITVPSDAETITKYIEKHCKLIRLQPSELTITDATSGVGGNVISFAKTFKSVNAIELDTLRYQFLNNNVNAYEYDNVMCYNDDCLNLIYTLKSNIIFFDPPWGGGSYKDETKLRLKLGDNYIDDICYKLISENSVSIITLKLPKNYDLKSLYDKLTIPNVSLYSYTLNRMIVFVIVNNS